MSRVDVLVIGAGPAALCLSAALTERGVRLQGLAPVDPAEPWPNTYGIWGPEVDALGLASLLGHRWSDACSYFGADQNSPAVAHQIDYGLFNKNSLQAHWLGPCRERGVLWHRGEAAEIHHDAEGSTVTTREGQILRARVVVDASGHKAVFVQRPDQGPVAGQAAYGIVGRFSAPPVDHDQFVLMDYRCDHLTVAERDGAPTFLYAMDLGDGLFFVEETSLAQAPPVPYAVLKDRLHRRLAHRGIAVVEIEHEEFCLFPMNLPLPDLHQPLLAFGGAASMVHPASGYLVGSLLRRAPDLAAALAAALADAQAGPTALARAGWQALWPAELRRKHALYQFGLEKLMRFPENLLRAFFATFFALPQARWYGFLSNTLSLPELLLAMIQLFVKAPWSVRWALVTMQGREWSLALRLLWPESSPAR